MKNREWEKWMICIVGILFLIGCTAKTAAPPDNFTAKMVTMGIETPMAKMGTKNRVENPMMNGIVTISEAGSSKVIIMSSVNKTYIEQTAQNQAPAIDDPGVVVDKMKIGSETWDGHPCDKYDIVMYKKDKPEDKYRARIWEATDLGGLAIRTEMDIPTGGQAGGGKMITELKDVKLGAANASMFEVPADYRKVENTMELMAGSGAYPSSADIDRMKEMMKNMRKK